MSKRYYAVKKGKTPGIYRTWAECKEQVEGFSHPVYKGFGKLSDAEAFINNESVKPIALTDISEDDAVAYVDGSYDRVTKKYSYGIVFITKGRSGIETKCFSKVFDNSDMASMRNVAGEIMGASKSIDYAIKRRKKSLIIYYDYEGIEKWANDEWQAKKTGTAEYKAKVTVARELGLEIGFIKIKAHSGNKFNEMADSLAKGALEQVAK